MDMYLVRYFYRANNETKLGSFYYRTTTVGDEAFIEEVLRTIHNLGVGKVVSLSTMPVVNNPINIL